MKLLYLIDTIYNSSGMERVLITKVNYLTRVYGYEITIVTTHEKGRPPFFPIDPRVQLLDLNVNTHLPFTIPLYVKRLKKVVEQIQPDIIISLCSKEIHHLQELPGDSVKMAEYHFSHQMHIIQGRFKRVRRLEESVGKLDCFVVLTKEDEAVWKQFTSKLVQIYNPSSFPEDGAAAELEASRCISGGRFEKQKNYKDMIRLWHIVHQKHPDWVLDLYGNGKHQRPIIRLIRELGLEAVVRLHPATKQMREEMLGSSAYLLTSLYEGFPMVLVETASVGLPCVAYRCPCGPGEFIQDGVDGFTAAPGAIEEMAAKLCRLIEDPQLRKTMGKNIRSKSQLYTEERIMPQWDALFKQLYASKHAE